LTNTSKYNSKLLRAQPAAPAARTGEPGPSNQRFEGSGVIGTVNPYWLWQAEERKPSTARRAAGYKRARKPYMK